ncbi:unnamed protein product [Discula destructiva]
MASLLVAGAKPKPRTAERRRLSFRHRGGTPQAEPAPAAETAKPTKEGVKLLLWAEIEQWQQHGSEHIHSGYRSATASITDCFSSWLYIHNETVNIYSHIVGAAVFLLLPVYVFAVSIPPRYQVATTADVLVCSTYFLGVAACFILSTTFHTLMSHSQAAYLQGMKLDFQGVLVLMWSATLPLVFYAFACEDGRLVRALYVGLFTLLAVACSAVTFLPQFSGPHLGPYRAALFGSFGVSSFALPIGHGLLREGLDEMWERVGLGWIVATVVCDGIGAGLYVLKFPEGWYPRRFDIFGASHQLMHICVVVAALTYTCAVVQAFDHRHEQGEMCVS